MTSKSWIPEWLTRYRKTDLSGDLNAGITVGIMLVPQGMAYAMLAGLPPVYGLYTAIFPILAYALLGTSRQLAVGPVAMDSILVASGVGAIAAVGSEEYIFLAISLALIVGIMQFALGFFKMGMVVNFLSKPVIAGFTAAAALIIGSSQLQHLFGIKISRGNILHTLSEVFSHLSQINPITFAIGVGAIVFIKAAKKITPKLPTPLLVVAISTLLVYWFRWDLEGASIVGNIPSKLPKFAIPQLTWSTISDLFMIGVTIAIIGFMEAFSVAKAVQEKHINYEIDANSELKAIGMSNIFGSFFSGYPVTGGFSRTAVNDQAGANTQLAGIISAIVVLLTLLFFTPLLYFLPKAVLAAIILVAVLGLIKIEEPKRLYRLDKVEFGAYLMTFIVTLGLGIKSGILAGVIFSMVMVIYRLSYPHMAILGAIPGSEVYRNIKRFSDLIQSDDYLVVRLDAPMFFANSDYFKSQVLNEVSQSSGLKYVIIEASGINHIDSSAVQMNLDLQKELESKDIHLMYSDVKGPVRDLFRKYGLFEQIGRENFFLTTGEAVKAIKNNLHVDSPDALQYSQTN